ncbi:hypothetical protein ABZ456_06515 [Streptomyces sp. NPDC005776]|uniref:DUF7224 domain-containing protein n=1 Tax=Streptomyces sp. NPDC005776 TaxID=3154676 RepID=UPI0033DF9332
MITWGNLRASAAPWLLLPALLFVYLYMDDAIYTVPSHYGVEAGELTDYGLPVIAPVVAGVAAWEAGRHRFLGALRNTSARARISQLIRAITPALVLHILLIAAALVLARQAVGVWPGDAGWFGVLHLFVIPLGWLVIGWSLGILMPKSLAAPLVGISCWAWMAMPHAMTNSWVRHLGGFIDGTSTITDVRAAPVYTVPWLVTAGFALAFGCLTGIRRRPWTAVLSLIVLIASITGGRALVSEWGYQNPTDPRVVALVCTGEAPAVCVPPEYEPYAEQLRHDALIPLNRLSAAGIPVPQVLRVASPKEPTKPGTWPLYWSLPLKGADHDQEKFVANLAESAVAGEAARAGVTDCGQPGSAAAAWAALVAGVDEQRLRTSIPAPGWAELQRIRRLPVKKQADWFANTAAEQKHCRQGIVS